MTVQQQITEAQTEMNRLTDKRDAQARKIGRATMKRNELNRRIFELGQRIKTLQRKPEPKSDVITFRKSYVGSGKIYTYAAIRSNRAWYVTGATGPNGVTWDRLVEFIERDNTLPFNVDERLVQTAYTVLTSSVTPTGF